MTLDPYGRFICFDTVKIRDSSSSAALKHEDGQGA